jgi:iron complex transport system substrate-binding protein
MDFSPKRIICLTEETVETLYLLGEQDRIVGVSGFSVRPPQVRKQKPIISTFTDADIDKIMALKPDLVIGFSDIQSVISKELIARGITVWVNNYRTVDGIFNMIGQLGSLVGKSDKAKSLIDQYRKKIDEINKEAREENASQKYILKNGMTH